jgi:hypothetical protein
MHRRWTALVALAGVAGTAGLAGGCSLGTQSDGESPSLIITSPTTDTVSGTVVFSADAVDASGIAKVRFSVDATLLVEDLTVPYETVWHSGPASKGAHTLKAEAFDLSGNSTLVTKVVIVTDPKQ